MAKARPNSKARLKKEYLSLYLEPAQAKALRELSEKTFVPQQAFLREGVQHVLEKYANILKKKYKVTAKGTLSS